MKKDTTIEFSYSLPGNIREWGFFGKKIAVPGQITFQTGVPGSRGEWHLTREEWNDICARQMELPAYIFRTEKNRWWIYKNEFYYHAAEVEDPVLIKGLLVSLKRRAEAKDERLRRLAQEE